MCVLWKCSLELFFFIDMIVSLVVKKFVSNFFVFDKVDNDNVIYYIKRLYVSRYYIVKNKLFF